MLKELYKVQRSNICKMIILIFTLCEKRSISSCVVCVCVCVLILEMASAVIKLYMFESKSFKVNNWKNNISITKYLYTYNC